MCVCVWGVFGSNCSLCMFGHRVASSDAFLILNNALFNEAENCKIGQ